MAERKDGKPRRRLTYQDAIYNPEDFARMSVQGCLDRIEKHEAAVRRGRERALAKKVAQAKSSRRAPTFIQQPGAVHFVDIEELSEQELIDREEIKVA